MKTWEKTVSGVLASLFGVSVLALMVMLLVVDEDALPSWIETATMVATGAFYILWAGWNWLPRITIEKIEDK